MPLRTSRLAGLAVAAAVGGAALSASPALAAGGSTCTYNPDTKSVIVDDHSGIGKQLRLMRVGNQIRIADTPVGGATTSGTFCVGGPLTVATVTNTDQIVVFSDYSELGDLTPADGFVIDQSGGFFGPGATPEADPISEIEVTIHTAGTPAKVDVIGTKATDPTTHGDDEIRVGISGWTNLGYGPNGWQDQDVDIKPDSLVTNMTVKGLDGNDTLVGTGNEISHNMGYANAYMVLDGGDGHDLLVGGLNQDQLWGGKGDDRMFTDGGGSDSIDDEAGDDTAQYDKSDWVAGVIEHRFKVGS
jgi:hypothetical protein